jgi:hypothetical protein
VSAPLPPSGDATPALPDEATQDAAAAALRAAFTRLQPQGSNPWNFLSAFNHLADRYGPDHPGASALAEVLHSSEASPSRLGRIRQRAGRVPATPGSASELEDAMAQVIEAFRWLAARVQTLEDRLSREDHPLSGPSWLAPASELDQWVAPVTMYLTTTSTGGEVLHGDCGRGALLGALRDAGMAAVGVEPRGGVALEALEAGHSVALCEVTEAIAGRAIGSLGGVVLSGVVDRLPLHDLVLLLAQTLRALEPGAPLVVLSSDSAVPATQWGPEAVDLIAARPLQAATWELLLSRAGFVGVAPLPGPNDEARFALTASAPE